MTLVVHATVVTMDPARPVVPQGRVFVGEDGRIEAVLGRGEAEPSGYAQAPRVARGGIVCPGLVDLHNHLAFNAIPLWLPARQSGYPTRYAWSKDKAHYRREVYLPAVIQGLTAGKALLKYAEVKAVISGATGVQGSAKLSRPYEGWLVRNVEDETFGRGRAFDLVRQSVLPLRTTQIPDVRDALAAGKRFLYHLSEGVSPSLRGEYTQLRDNGLLRPGLVGIHSTALTPADFAEWGGIAPGAVVWSPLSNLLLYGQTTDVVAARDSGHVVAMGPDWSPTGSKGMLGELKVADLVNRTQFDSALSQEDLLAMATVNASTALGWREQLGTLAAGQLADMLLTRRRDADPYRSVVHATERDVMLVSVGGRAVYGTPAAMRDAGASGSEPIALGRLRRSIALVDPRIPDADMSWQQVLAALDGAARAPRSFGGLGLDVLTQDLTRELTLELTGMTTVARTEAARDLPLMVLPDLPAELDEDPEQAARRAAERAVDPAELVGIQVPPLDSLLTDERFLETVASATIPAGTLSGLADYWA